MSSVSTNTSVNKTLFEWATEALQTIYLWTDEVSFSRNTTSVVTRNVARERKLAISLINAGAPRDFYDCARQLCPVGTIIEPFEKDDWESLYNDKVKLVFTELTKGLLDERFSKSAKILLDILGKRSENWKEKEKTATVKTPDTTITFTIG